MGQNKLFINDVGKLSTSYMDNVSIIKCENNPTTIYIIINGVKFNITCYGDYPNKQPIVNCIDNKEDVIIPDWNSSSNLVTMVCYLILDYISYR